MTPRSRPGVPWARFDDLQTGTAVQCPTPHRVLVAERPEQVVGVLAEVERATDAGDWAFGYVAYEAAAGLDPHLVVHRSSPIGMPLVWFGLCDEPIPVPPLDAAEQGRSPAHAEWHPTWTPAGHARDVARVRDRIAAGDTYQCNLTVRMAGRVHGDPFGLYRDLALGQRGAHNAYLDLGRFAVASASPELFFERRGDQVLLRPMKGTARRGRHLREDEALAHRLRSSAKEQAENVMIVDLLRNDVARVAETGSVAVPALFTVERYETVLQLTSDVTARLRPGTGLVELFRALFPCGSVTGRPRRAPWTSSARSSRLPAASTAARSVSSGRPTRRSGPASAWPSGPPSWTRRRAMPSTAPAAASRGTRSRRRSTPRSSRRRLSSPPAPGSSSCWRPCGTNRTAACATVIVISGVWRSRPSTWGSGSTCPARWRRCGRGSPDGDAARVRLRLRRTGAVAVDVEALPATLPEPVLLALDDEPVDPFERWLYHKTTFREPYDRRRLRRPDVDDVIMVNTRGELTEVTRATLALKVDGTWWTPPLASGCLPGVERARLLDLGVLHERVLRRADLDAAHGLAVISSLRGWRDARLLADVAGSGAGAAAEGGDDVRPEHQGVARNRELRGPAAAGQMHA